MLPVAAVMWPQDTTLPIGVTFNLQGWLITSAEARILAEAHGSLSPKPSYLPSGVQLQAVLVVGGPALNDSTGEVTYVFSASNAPLLTSSGTTVWSTILNRKVEYAQIAGSSVMGRAYPLELSVLPPDGSWVSAESPTAARQMIDGKIDAWVAQLNSTFDGTNLVTVSRTQLLDAPAEVRVQTEGYIKNSLGEFTGFPFSGLYVQIYLPAGTYVIRSVLTADETMRFIDSLR
jgi:hypothetical protein